MVLTPNFTVNACGDTYVVADQFNIDMTVEKLKCLRDLQWLNSETIGFVMEWWVHMLGLGRCTHQTQLLK
jgi:Ulp1 family protease